ncbi:MAG: WbqC family protein [Bacteroidia bacterium]|nr:WbqC family protein [Bacteroidia bacterium]
MKQKAIIIDLQYLPCVEYFLCFRAFPKVCLDIYEYYEKQSYRNRCRIMTAHGPQDLSIPVIKPGHQKRFKDIRIDYSQKWVNIHWRTIQSAYGKAPFF